MSEPRSPRFPTVSGELGATSRPEVDDDRLVWWRELLTIGAFYAIYSLVRNEYGSAAVEVEVAHRHAEWVISLEKAVHLFFEERFQNFFVSPTYEGGLLVGLRYGFPGAKTILWIANVVYATLHFLVTPGVLIYLWHRHHGAYRRWRNLLAATTALALVGFALFPLMPPRLLAECGSPYGACDLSYSFVDTMKHVGGLWSFDSSAMQRISNQYAAMPSLHFAWSLWCWLALRSRVSRRARLLVGAYPWLTLAVIVLTANHYWMDAAGGAAVFLASFPLATSITRVAERRRPGRSVPQRSSR